MTVLFCVKAGRPPSCSPDLHPGMGLAVKQDLLCAWHRSGSTLIPLCQLGVLDNVLYVKKLFFGCPEMFVDTMGHRTAALQMQRDVSFWAILEY